MLQALKNTSLVPKRELPGVLNFVSWHKAQILELLPLTETMYFLYSSFPPFITQTLIPWLPLKLKSLALNKCVFLSAQFNFILPSKSSCLSWNQHNIQHKNLQLRIRAHRSIHFLCMTTHYLVYYMMPNILESITTLIFLKSELKKKCIFKKSVRITSKMTLAF